MVVHVDVDVPQLWRAYRANPLIELRNQLVENYLPLVKYNAERIWQRLPEGVDLDDLISAGVFGLMDAIDAFDLTRGVKFETYCVPRIRGAMLESLKSALADLTTAQYSRNGALDDAALDQAVATGDSAARRLRLEQFMRQFSWRKRAAEPVEARMWSR